MSVILIKAELKSASIYGQTGSRNWYFHGSLDRALQIIDAWNEQCGGYYRCDITITDIKYVDPEVIYCEGALARYGFPLGDDLASLEQ